MLVAINDIFLIIIFAKDMYVKNNKNEPMDAP
ncbi:hypothetical protein MNBD_BACTEROID04-964, partial [hydrothermal vent metagenome]